MLGHPAVGGSWEGFVIENLLADLPSWASPHFYRTSAGAEIDLLIEAGNKKIIASEIKRSMSPSLSKGFLIGCEDVGATRRYFVYSGVKRFQISKEVTALPLTIMIGELKQML